MRLLTLTVLLFFCFSCSSEDRPVTFEKVNVEIPEPFIHLINKALEKSGKNRAQLEKALSQAERELREGVVYLIAFMPERDLRDLTADYILENARSAYEARKRFTWAKEIPQEVFFNDVLPYATLNERRDNWRADFYQRFSRVVKNCTTLHEAILAVNKAVMKETGVKYSTKRSKPDQSPYESMESKMASCTGLSILLVNAFRSVGIPARIVGTPAWTQKKGNHNWVEVWHDHQWKFTEYYFAGLNKGWFVKDASLADPTRWQNRIYATSFSPREFWFPLVWDLNIRYVHALDVSEKYGSKTPKKKSNKLKRVTVVCYSGAAHERMALPFKILDHNGEKVAEGVTKGNKADKNDLWEAQLSVGTYVVEYSLPNKGRVRQKFSVKNRPLNQVVIHLH